MDGLYLAKYLALEPSHPIPTTRGLLFDGKVKDRLSWVLTVVVRQKVLKCWLQSRALVWLADVRCITQQCKASGRTTLCKALEVYQCVFNCPEIFKFQLEQPLSCHCGFC